MEIDRKLIGTIIALLAGIFLAGLYGIVFGQPVPVTVEVGEDAIHIQPDPIVVEVEAAPAGDLTGAAPAAAAYGLDYGTTHLYNLDLGGSLEVESTTTITGAVSMASTLAGSGAATFADDLTVSGCITVDQSGGDLALADDLDAGGGGTFVDDVTVTGVFTVDQSTADVSLADKLIVAGAVDLADTLAVESTMEVTGAVTLNSTLDVATAIQYGSGDLYPVGHATKSYEIEWGSEDITGTLNLDHGLTTVTWALCTLGQDPDDDAGDGAYCTVEVSGNAVTLKVWQDDWVTEATETDVTVHYLIIGE